MTYICSVSIRSIGFSFPDSILSKVPTEKINEISELIEKTKKDIEEIEIELVNSENKIEELKFLQDYETMRADKYEAIGYMLQTNNMFVLSGFIPSDKTQIFMEDISSKFDAYVEFEEPSDDDDVPTLLKNNNFSSPLESTITSFGAPSRGELDPTMMMSLFYYMLFGLMLSDAAYGAIIILALLISILGVMGIGGIKVILKMLTKYCMGKSGQIIFSQYDKDRMPKQFGQQINKAISNIRVANLVISEETRSIDGGFVLNYGEIEQNCSFDALFLDKYEQKQS